MRCAGFEHDQVYTGNGRRCGKSPYTCKWSSDYFVKIVGVNFSNCKDSQIIINCEANIRLSGFEHDQWACSWSYRKTKIGLRFILWHILVLKQFLELATLLKNHPNFKRSKQLLSTANSTVNMKVVNHHLLKEEETYNNTMSELTYMGYKLAHRLNMYMYLDVMIRYGID